MYICFPNGRRTVTGMAEYIEKEAVERLVSNVCEECREACLEFDGIYADCHQCLFERVKDGVPKIPAADVAPVRHGKWVEKHYGGNLYAHVCSECGAKRNVLTYGYKFNYCSSCGARMDGAG